jgi:hypothetical protein
MATTGQPDEVRDERRVRSLSALVRRHAGELEELLHIAGVEIVDRGVVAYAGGEAASVLLEPLVHSESLTACRREPPEREDRVGHDREHVQGREGGSGRRIAAEVQREAAQAGADEVADLRC